MERAILHIVGGESRSRAEQARTAFALGHHAEVYADMPELLDQQPKEGIVLLAESGDREGVRQAIKELGSAGIWLPIVVTGREIELDLVVAAIRGGALDYLALPLEIGSFARRLHAILADAGPYEARRRSEVEARHRIAHLSRRERQVLALLSAGRANKEIAQQLGISPRTVEIHRANMMGKLGAGHAADAVKAWLAAGVEEQTHLKPAPGLSRPRYRVVGNPADDAAFAAEPRVKRG